MTGARLARRLLAALLAAPLSLASSPAWAQAASGASPSFAIQLSANSVTEEGGSVTVTVLCTDNCGMNTFDGQAAARHSSAYIDIAITGAAGSLTGNRRLTYTPAARTAFHYAGATGTTAMPVGTVTITTVGDMTVTGDRTVTVSGTLPYNPTDYWFYWDERPRIADATLTVLDDDAPPVTLSLSRSEIYEDPNRAASQRRATVTASLENAALATTTITVSAEAGTNAAADDFTLSGTTLTIAAGTTTSTGVVTITAENDQIDSLVKTPSLLDEDGEDTGRVLNGKLVTVSGTLSSGTATAPSGKSLKIFEDDVAALVYTRAPLAPPDLAPPDRFCTRFPNSPGCASPYLTVKESGSGNTAMFQVKLATQPTADVTVAVSSADDGEGLVSKAADAAPAGRTTLTFTSQNWNADQTVTLTGVYDGEADGDQEYKVNVNPNSASTDAYSLRPRTRGLQMKTEDTVLPPGLVLPETPVSTSEPSGADTFTVKLATRPTADVMVGISVTGGDTDEATVSPSSLTFTRDNWNTVQTVTVTGQNDDDADGLQEYAITLTPSSPDSSGDSIYHALSVSTVLGRNADDDAPQDPQPQDPQPQDPQPQDPQPQDPQPQDPQPQDPQPQDPQPTVTLSLSSASISENGGSTTVSARLSHASSMATTITIRPVPGLYTVGADNTIVIPAGQTTSADRVTITAVDNAQRSASDPTVTIAAAVDNDMGTGAVNAAAVVVLDDETASVSLALAPERAAEGAAVRVTAVLNRAAPAAVTVSVSAAPGTNAAMRDFRLSENRTLTVAAGATRSAGTVTITATDDAVDAPDRTVTVSGAVSSENRAREPEAVTLTIEDDDETPVATLSLTPAVIDESGANNASTVSATLSNPSSEATTITVSAQGAGYAQRGTTLTIPALGTTSAGAVTLTAVDDEEQTPDREVTVSGRAENAHGVEQPAAVVLTIRDDDGTEMVTEVLLPEAARAMADSRATAVRQRLERAGMEETAELPSLTGLLAQHGPSAQEDSLEWKTLLPQASFALALDADGGGAGGGVTVWGGGDYRNLDGEARGVSWDGEAASAHLGADRLLANGLRVGVAASWSEAKFDYEHKGRSGDWELEMSSAQPYLGWTTAGGIDLWASAGVGSGELEITAGAGGARQSSDADMWLAAAGARGPLYATDSGLEVSLRGEALYSSFEVDGNGSRIRGHTSDVSRLRLALEARRERTLASGARLSPRFELGLRHDGGDGETGAGLELGGGAEYVSGRLRLAGGARALAANSDYDEWGAEAALEYAPGADGRGLTLRLAPSWGAAQSGAAQLWEQGAPGLDGTAAEPDLGGRLAAELGYGLKSPWSRGLLTLALGGELGEDEGVAARLSGRVALDGTSALGLELKLREPKSGGTEHSLMLTGELRF